MSSVFEALLTRNSIEGFHGKITCHEMASCFHFLHWTSHSGLPLTFFHKSFSHRNAELEKEKSVPSKGR
jgi:hypothetical protein